MIVDVPFNYKARLVPPGRHKAAEHDVRAVHTVRIAEATAEEAPIVAWWTPPKFSDAEQVAIRYVDGHLYQPLTASPRAMAQGKDIVKGIKDPSARRIFRGRSREDGLSVLVGAEAARDLLAKGEFCYPAHEHVSRMTFDAKAPTVDQIPHRKVEGHALASSIQVIEEVISRFVVVGDTLYHRIEQPLLVVDLTWSQPKIATHHVDDGLHQRSMAYRLDRWADAEATWREEIRHQGHWQDEFKDPNKVPYPFRKCPAPEILRPDLLDFDDHAYAVTGAAAEVVRRMGITNQSGYSRYHGAPEVARHERGIALAFARLRDAVAADAAPDDLVPLLRDFAEATEGVGLLIDDNRAVHALLRRVERECGDDLALANAMGGL